MNPQALVYEVINSMLEATPEIRPGYEKMRADLARPTQRLSQQALEELEEIGVRFELGPLDPKKPGAYIVTEELFVPLLVDLVEAGNLERAGELMMWVEEMAARSEPAIRDLVGVALCENFVATHARLIDRFYPLMGPHTKAMCIQVMPGFIVSERTRKVFGLP